MAAGMLPPCRYLSNFVEYKKSGLTSFEAKPLGVIRLMPYFFGYYLHLNFTPKINVAIKMAFAATKWIIISKGVVLGE